MKKYYALLNTNDLYYLGEFLSYSDAYDYAEYDLNICFVWIFKEANLKILSEKIDNILIEQ